MIQRLVLLSLVGVLLSVRSHACAEPIDLALAASIEVSECKVLLRSVGHRVPKVTWESCKARPGRHDPAHCRLLEPANAGLQSCLIDAIADKTSLPDPRCPSLVGVVALGDLAFFALSDVNPTLWKAVLPASVIGQPADAYHQWVNLPGNRAALQRAVREHLQSVR